jgi:chromosome segregation ATPase
LSTAAHNDENTHNYEPNRLKLQKDLDQKECEIAELACTKGKLRARVEEMEHQIADLMEQVCCAVTHLLLGVEYRQVAGIIHSLSMDTKSINLYNRSVLFFGIFTMNC